MRSAEHLFERYGPWAIVTGASSGIGEAFAKQLGEAGLHLLLIARHEERLEAVARRIRETSQVEVRTAQIDLAQPEAPRLVSQAAEGLDVGLLVNNAGTGRPGAFLKQSVEEAERFLQLNCTTPMKLAHEYGNRMARQGKGGLVFLSSAMGYQGTPYMAQYAATKAYTLSLGEALHQELKPEGVDVLVVAPGATDTPGARLYEIEVEGLPIPWMSAEEVAAKSLKALGRKSSLPPGVRNHLITCVGSGLWTRTRLAPFFARMARKVMPADMTSPLRKEEEPNQISRPTE